MAAMSETVPGCERKSASDGWVRDSVEVRSKFETRGASVAALNGLRMDPVDEADIALLVVERSRRAGEPERRAGAMEGRGEEEEEELVFSIQQHEVGVVSTFGNEHGILHPHHLSGAHYSTVFGVDVADV